MRDELIWFLRKHGVWDFSATYWLTYSQRRKVAVGVSPGPSLLSVKGSVGGGHLHMEKAGIKYLKL